MLIAGIDPNHRVFSLNGQVDIEKIYNEIDKTLEELSMLLKVYREKIKEYEKSIYG